MTGISTGPSSREVTYASDSAGSATSTTDLDPMQNLIERVRITAIDFANSRVSCESILLSNDGSGNPQAQGMLFSHTNDTPVWFTVGKADIIIDPGSTTRAANVNTRAEFTFGHRYVEKSAFSEIYKKKSVQVRFFDSFQQCTSTANDPTNDHASSRGARVGSELRARGVSPGTCRRCDRRLSIALHTASPLSLACPLRTDSRV